ncbi:MAG: hypothetical protein JRJ12_11100 [Deltaproteobacteria bacterium]|nr:hypothetical protein [Deltaproteobacteria bacterium]MBW2072135.1 hypothetical protein [Deltaproteobacteria bacterium]
MQIELDCPQCGGIITIDEELEVVRCGYCSSTMYIGGKSEFPSFMLAPRWSVEQCDKLLTTFFSTRKVKLARSKKIQLLYAPYWRCKGMVFHWVAGKKEKLSGSEDHRSWEDIKELHTKAFDFTFPAYDNVNLGLQSLGVRTAALKLRLYHSSRLAANALRLPINIPPAQAVKHSQAFLNFGFADSSLRVDLEDTQLVGEVYSLVYFPFWLLQIVHKEKPGLLIIDAVGNRVTRTVWNEDISTLLSSSALGKDVIPPGTLSLVPHRCPVCGWDLPLLSQSKVHICTTCSRAWSERHGSYRETEFQLANLPADWKRPFFFLPFWELQAEVHTSEEVLRTWADLGKIFPALTLGSIALTASQPICLRIPAFKINSMPAFLKLASRFTVNPPAAAVRAKEQLAKFSFDSVFLPGKEAVDMGRVVLLSLMPRYNRRARALLKNFHLDARPPVLRYYPFYRKGIYLREIHTDHTIQSGTVSLATTDPA